MNDHEWDAEIDAAEPADTDAAKVARVEALAKCWEGRWDVPERGVFDASAQHYRAAASQLRAALNGGRP